MESALDVLSRAATMVQDNANETRLTSKELPTTAWRRERRLRTGEYHHPHHHPSSGSPPLPAAHIQYSSMSSGSASNASSHIHPNAHQISVMMAAAASIRPLNESINRSSSSPPPPHSALGSQIHLSQLTHPQALHHMNSVQNDDVPLDMSVANLKQRNSPPPPYREPLPGSQFASSLARPSVITQAPPKREVRDSALVTNRENDNRSCESIDEHFRRSLGNEYFSLFSKRSPSSLSTKTPSPQPYNTQPPTAHIRSPSPTLPLSFGTSTLPTQSSLAQSEIIPPPAYPANLSTGNIHPNSQQAHQNQELSTSKINNVHLSPATIVAQMKISTESNSPPLPLVVRSKHQHPIVLQKASPLIPITSLLSTKSPASTTGAKLGSTAQPSIFNTPCSRTASPSPLLQHQHHSIAMTLPHQASVDNSPSSSPRHTPPVLNMPVQNTSSNLPAIIRIKTEPGLQNLKSNNPTPPASPTSNTNHNINSNFTSYSSNTSSPSSPKTLNWKTSTNACKANAEVLASVDDHFAKALGATWKKLQENKEIRK